MFLGQVPRRPKKEEAMKELKANATMFFTFIAVVRTVPYVLHYLYGEKDELKLDFS